jgi:hypothetical protein
MTKEQLDACIQMLQDVSSRMRDAEPDAEEADAEPE